MTNRTIRRQAQRSGRQAPPPAAPTALPGTYQDQLTDRYGDTLRVYPAGSGHVLIEIEPADPDQPCVSVEIPETWIPRLAISAVRATGKTPAQLGA